jgi:hypothetical protein
MSSDNQTQFGQCSPAERYRSYLYNLKKMPTETLQQYGARGSQQMAKSYPSTRGMSIFETLAIEYFVQGLPEKTLAYDILVKKPRNLGEAMDMVTRHDTCNQSTGRFSGTRHTR